MEFTIDRDTFSRALQKIQGIVEKRNTMPILSNVLIEALEDRIELTATDLEVGMKSSYPTTVAGQGKITVSAKKLYEIVKELPDETISFLTKANDYVEIRCGKAKFTIVGLSSEEFPYFPKVNEESFIRIESGLLADMIEKTSYAICFDETKYNLNGTFVKASEEDGRSILRMVATDGHRLSITQREFNGAVSPEMAKGVIFPKKGIFELKKMCEEESTQLSLGFMDNSAVLVKGNTVVVMRLVDGEFPDYTRVVPVANDRIVTVARDPFFHSLRRMSILSSEKFKGIKMDIQESGMVISSSNPELGEASEELDAVFAGDAISIRFNAKYLIDVLAVLDESSVALHLKDELSPAIVRPADGDDFTAVIMPMRL
ncbi:MULTISPECIES: DNA polymerase III subunit beta [Geobacter]|uniref:DNA polymerase III subunit beta n=1 Tax=Geobacter TaxID=28231 RepID=UPI0025743F78|nr:DNA polymerase III subunit beta [Geobacter sulfurreducens]BEH08390.1 DNA polymerase III subunit beta [Geobacter sulfurreducens subsp. ethanolicus]BET59869.1 DNA polymerase III subunit beta [Geobacter sp. 60473]HML77276.1 DNA polymerase III subunit beta [Geobacter sulfurreducens]